MIINWEERSIFPLVGRQRCRRPRVVPIHCTVERAPLGHGRRAPRMAGGGSTCGPHSAWPGYMCCRACTAESTAPRSTVHLKRIPEGPCEGAPPPRRAPTPRSFGRPAPFVCRSPGQRPTHSLKGSVSEAPAHASAVPVAVEVSTACVYRWQEQQPGKTWEGQCLSTGRRTLGFSAH
jgi:hypothetical protein